MNKSHFPLYKTSDLYFAAYLKAAQVSWVGTEPGDARGRLLFVFEDEGQLESLKKAFFNRSSDSRVVALNYANEIQALKAVTRV